LLFLIVTAAGDLDAIEALGDQSALGLLDSFTETALAQNLVGVAQVEENFVIKDPMEVVPNLGGPGTQPTMVITNKALYLLAPLEPLKRVSGQVLYRSSHMIGVY
jgi:hypothetical protein